MTNFMRPLLYINCYCKDIIWFQCNSFEKYAVVLCILTKATDASNSINKIYYINFAVRVVVCLGMLCWAGCFIHSHNAYEIVGQIVSAKWLLIIVLKCS